MLRLTSESCLIAWHSTQRLQRRARCLRYDETSRKNDGFRATSCCSRRRWQQVCRALLATISASLPALFLLSHVTGGNREVISHRQYALELQAATDVEAFDDALLCSRCSVESSTYKTRANQFGRKADVATLQLGLLTLLISLYTSSYLQLPRRSPHVIHSVCAT